MNIAAWLKAGFVIGCIAVVIALVFAAAGLDSARSSGSEAPSGERAKSFPATELAKASSAEAYPRLESVARGQGTKIWAADELAKYDGSDVGAPLLLSILGEVYDVGPGARFYAPKAGYSHMAGCDNSRSFTSTDDDDSENEEDVERTKACQSKVLDLKPESVDDILNWRDFYRDHKEYRYVGVLHDRFFGADGAPTAESLSLEELRSASKKTQELEQDLQKRFMSCNSRHESAKPYFELWCSDGYHPKGSTPLHFYYKLPQKEEKGRCACLRKKDRKAVAEEAAAQLERPQPGKATIRLVDYTDCEEEGQKCRRPKGAKPPM